MVLGIVLTWSLLMVMVGSGCLWGVVMLVRIPDRTADDVLDYVVPVELEKIEALLDPAIEYSHRMYLHPREFRRCQMKRIHLLMELLRRISHNAHVLMEFANTQVEQTASVAVAEAAYKLREKALAVQLRARSMLVMLHCSLILLRFSQASRLRFSMSSLRRDHGIPTLTAYLELRTAALNLHALLRPNSTDRLSLYL